MESIRDRAVRFFNHFEDCYVKHQTSRVNLSKYVMHLLLHLADGILESGPLVNASQYWVEGFIGWVVDRCNARYAPGASMFNSAAFAEEYKIFFKAGFHGRESKADDVDDRCGYQLLGPHKEKDLECMGHEWVRLRGLIASYLHRKFDSVNMDVARHITAHISFCRFSSRVRFISESQTQTASVYKDKGKARPSHFVAVEMDEMDQKADVYYGQLRQLITFEIKTDSDGEMGDDQDHCWHGTHTVMVVAWASGLVKGRQNQIYKAGHTSQMFANATVEDVTTLRRLIGVVEHTIPRIDSAGGSRGGSSRGGAPVSRNGRIEVVCD